MKAYIFLANGFEEIEALATVDVLRRAGLDVVTVSVQSGREATGAHGIAVLADTLFADNNYKADEWLVCPGGMPGATNLYEYAPLSDLLVKHFAAGGHIAAICAAPAVVLAQLGILNGKNATCYPGFEAMLAQGGATPTAGRVAVDGTVITANGPASAIPFALAIAEAAVGTAAANEVAAGMLC